MAVEVDDEFHESPSVIVRWRPATVGNTLQLDGHTDTVSQPHSAPSFHDGLISGRGAADMKGGRAAMAEAARIVTAWGVALRGSLLVTAHGQHENPVAPNELHPPMFALFRKAIVGTRPLLPQARATRW